MEKTIWIIADVKQEMIEAQRGINASGSMRAFCMLSWESVKKAVDTLQSDGLLHKNNPSLIILDYEMDQKTDFQLSSMLKNQQFLAGVPLFYMVDNRTDELDEECYEKGATVVLRKPFSSAELLRIERTAWQHEVTKNYEKMLQKQASDLQAAKEIHQLNQQLKSRNELLHQIFGRYFSDKVVDVILEHPEGAAIGGEKREVTVMMSDLRGFTSVSENLEPDKVTDLLNYYFGEMLEVITEYHGVVIEFLGDGILAVFGAPLSSQQQSAEAVAAAICMQNRMENVNCYGRQQGYPDLEMGIGIHRGEVFIGNVGSEKMMRYNVIGNAVNQCSRIESFSVGGQVLVSKETLDMIDCRVKVGSQMEVAAKGVSKPMPVYEITEIEGEYHCALEHMVSDKMYPVETAVTFNLYPIEGKVVMEQPICAHLISFSRKRAKVVLEEVNRERLSEYGDVEIFAAGPEGRAIFTNVYAKIMGIEEDELTLCFTHVNKGFQRFAGSILEERNGLRRESV
jgi:class 3 adenylate cyclase/CheY-like chemotaxis protein